MGMQHPKLTTVMFCRCQQWWYQYWYEWGSWVQVCNLRVHTTNFSYTGAGFSSAPRKAQRTLVQNGLGSVWVWICQPHLYPLMKKSNITLSPFLFCTLLSAQYNPPDRFQRLTLASAWSSLHHGRMHENSALSYWGRTLSWKYPREIIGIHEFIDKLPQCIWASQC